MPTSIVIAAHSGPTPVLRALDSLASLPQYHNLEIVVANCCGSATERAIVSSHPEVKIVTLPAGTSIAESRHAAVQRSSGDIIAVLHERYRPSPDWAERINQAHAEEAGEVIAGCVAPSAGMSTAQWAMFLMEYAHACPPMPSGTLSRSAAIMIPGGNTSYRRAAFEKASMENCLWELDFHAALFDRHVRFYCDRGLIAEFSSSYTVSEYISERVRISRDHAMQRATNISFFRRLIVAASRVALPPLVVARITATLLRKRVYRGRLLLAMPWLAAFAIVQAWGEISGYMARRNPVPTLHTVPS